MKSVCHSAEWNLESQSASARRLRRLMTERLREWGVTERDVLAARIDDLVLATSEVVANAVRNGGRPVHVLIEAHRDSVRVAVSDDHPGVAVVGQAGPLEESGRGLSLVDTLSDEWGQERSPENGKTVWLIFEVPAGSALATGCQR